MVTAVITPARPVFAAPSITLSPSSGVAGTTVNLSGASFSSYTGDRLLVYLDESIVVQTGVVVSEGSVFQTTFVIPDTVQPGSHTVSIRARTGGVLAQSLFYVFPLQIVLSRWSGTVGSAVKASCKGFRAGQVVTVQYFSTNKPDIIVSQRASDIGECTVQFNIPVGVMGIHAIQATDESGNYAKAELEIIPNLSISPPIAGIGDRVDIAGTGFTGNSEIDVTLHGNKVAYAPVSDRGSFGATFYVPVMRAGTYSIAIQDADQEIRWIDFTVDTKLSINKSTGEVGFKVEISGTGFEVGGAITVDYDEAIMTLVTADKNGSFSAVFDVPVSIAGGHIITVSDGMNSKQVSFTVESNAPAVPETFVPKQNSLVGAQTFFDWESVFDLSQPVVYTLQISRTADFQHPILEKKELEFSEYTLSKDEALRPSRRSTNYYWRVKAIDSASNQGAWSESVAFKVEPSRTLPVWAEITLVGIGVLMIIILGSRIIKGVKTLKAEKDT